MLLQELSAWLDLGKVKEKDSVAVKRSKKD